MSDLLPLVAAVLKDKASVDAQDEIEKLRTNQLKLLKIFTAVEVIRTLEHDDDHKVVVYSTGYFGAGRPNGNPNLWDVDMESVSSCLLSDLRKCRLCVGGGFPIVSFNTQANNEGDGDGWLERGEDGKTIAHLCFIPYTIWVELAISGWPEEPDNELFESEEIISYLVDNIATAYPETTVEFRRVGFVSKAIHGPLKRLLSPEQRDEALASSYTS